MQYDEDAHSIHAKVTYSSQLIVPQTQEDPPDHASRRANIRPIPHRDDREVQQTNKRPESVAREQE